jgi:hypothetical protein
MMTIHLPIRILGDLTVWMTVVDSTVAMAVDLMAVGLSNR